MPHIDITMYPGRDRETKSVLATSVRDCVCEKLGLDPKFVTVSVEDVAPECWQTHMQRFGDDVMFVKPEK